MEGEARLKHVILLVVVQYGVADFCEGSEIVQVWLKTVTIRFSLEEGSQFDFNFEDLILL